MKRTLLSITAALLFGGCAHNVTPHQKAVAEAKGSGLVPVPSRFNAPHTAGTVQDNWIKKFRDPTLNHLVKEGIQNNPDLKIAATRVERALAMTRLTASGLYPAISMQGFYHDNNNAGAQEIAFGGFGISWEPDVWGRVSNLQAADRAYSRSEIADFEFARQSLASSIAEAWFTLNANSRLYQFNKEIVKLQKKGLFVLQKREEIGQGNKRDVHLSNALLAAAEDAAQASLSDKERSQRALEVLIGRYPAAKLQPKLFNRSLPPVPSDMPASILERRPDIIAAEERVAAAFHTTKATDLLRMPNVRLNLGIGPNSLNNAISSLTAGVFAPIYTGGAIRAQIDIATAEQKAAVASYAQTVLKAFKEVEDTLAAEKHLKMRYKYVSKMVREYKAAYDMTIEKYRIGESTVLDILIIQGKWIASEIAKVKIARDRLINRVRLHLALGGSFDTHPLKRTPSKHEEGK